MALCKSVCFGVLFLSCFFAFTAGKEPFVFHDRSSWGAQEAKFESKLKLPVPYVVIHHTYIPAACYSFQACSASMRSMQTYHMSLGWGDIGYNFCVGADGAVYEGRGWHNVGAHAKTANYYSIGICLIGDWREERPPAETLAATKALIIQGLSRRFISLDYKLIGHQQATATECPGKALMDEIETWHHYQHGHINFTQIAENEI